MFADGAAIHGQAKQLVRYLWEAKGQSSMMCLQFLKLWILGSAWICLAGVRIETLIVTDFVNVLMMLSLLGALACLPRMVSLSLFS